MCGGGGFRPCCHGSRRRKRAHLRPRRPAARAAHASASRRSSSRRRPGPRSSPGSSPCANRSPNAYALRTFACRCAAGRLACGGPAPPAQDASHRQSQMAREIVGLIESALNLARDAAERGRPHPPSWRDPLRRSHHRRQARGEHAAPLVLERMNDVAQRAVVSARAPRRLEQRWMAPTARAA